MSLELFQPMRNLHNHATSLTRLDQSYNVMRLLLVQGVQSAGPLLRMQIASNSPSRHHKASAQSSRTVLGAVVSIQFLYKQWPAMH